MLASVTVLSDLPWSPESNRTVLIQSLIPTGSVIRVFSEDMARTSSIYTLWCSKESLGWLKNNNIWEFYFSFDVWDIRCHVFKLFSPNMTARKFLFKWKMKFLHNHMSPRAGTVRIENSYFQYTSDSWQKWTCCFSLLLCFLSAAFCWSIGKQETFLIHFKCCTCTQW